MNEDLSQPHVHDYVKSVSKPIINNGVCVVCGDKTQVRFNIRFKGTPICESCANAITMQQVYDFVHRDR